MGLVPEVRTLLERAEARRLVLEGLIASVPREYWERRAPEDAWSAFDHFCHLATIDSFLSELLAAAAEAGQSLWVAGTSDARELEARRILMMESVTALGITELREAMRQSRAVTVEALQALPPESLGRDVRVAGVDSPWGEPRVFALRAYLTLWAEHDSDHEGAIRRAIETPPDASALSLAARRRQRG